MNDEQIDALKAAALAATPGPWRRGYFRHPSPEFGSDYAGWFDNDYVVSNANGSKHIAGPGGTCTGKEATYIAAASPDVVLALLAERDALRAAAERAVELISQCDAQSGPEIGLLDEAEAILRRALKGQKA